MLRSLVGSEMCIRDRLQTDAGLQTEAGLETEPALQTEAGLQTETGPQTETEVETANIPQPHPTLGPTRNRKKASPSPRFCRRSGFVQRKDHKNTSSRLVLR